MEPRDVWKVVDTFFASDKYALVKHHIASYDDFFEKRLQQIFRDNNVTPVAITSDIQPDGTAQYECKLYFGGRDGSKIRIEKPTITDSAGTRLLFPNEARLRNMTYAVTVYYDVEVEYITAGIVDPALHIVENIYLGRFPIMLHSQLCILRGMPTAALQHAGECRNDIGGYFIIDGKEKLILPQEKFADNMISVRSMCGVDGTKAAVYEFSATVRSVSENVAKPIRSLSISIIAPTNKYSNRNIVVTIPNVRKAVPLFIVFRALGVISDKAVIETCLLDMVRYEHLIDLFIPSVHDSATVMTQAAAIKHIALLTKYMTISYAQKVLIDFFLPHVGETNYLQKAYYLGHMVFRMMLTITGAVPPTDRDKFKYKRIELPGVLLQGLFREYYSIQLKNIKLGFKTKRFYNTVMYGEDLRALILDNQTEIFRDNTQVEQGFRRAFKGDWGSAAHTKRIGVVQDVNRLSKNSALSQLRKTVLVMATGTKMVEPHVLNASQWGFMDPMDSPDGGNIGLHKNLAIMTHVSNIVPRESVLSWLRSFTAILPLEEFSPKQLAQLTSVFVNGMWAGVLAPGTTKAPVNVVAQIHKYRRLGLFPAFISATFDANANSIIIYSDAGRLCRPLFYTDSSENATKGNIISAQRKNISALLHNPQYVWTDLVCGFGTRAENFDMYSQKFYSVEELYGSSSVPPPNNCGIIDYIDCSESENALIALSPDDFMLHPEMRYTHCEIHESLMLGVMCNQIPFAEHSDANRSTFSCAQSKQACSMFHTNYQSRMDKSAIVLNYGTLPIVKTRYSEYIDHGEHPYGENVTVAIMCYTGYNVEDAVLLNRAAVDRGMFRTTHYSMYEVVEMSEKVDMMESMETLIANPLTHSRIESIKSGVDYSLLDESGLIREGVSVTDKTVLIGAVAQGTSASAGAVDKSVLPKKGQLGKVDRIYMTSGVPGKRVAKVRVLEQRRPAMGDKMASRLGQKGVVGLVIEEADMPFTREGLRPDMIINPHAFPTRKTISQLIESLLGKTCIFHGAHGDGTTFATKGDKVAAFGAALQRYGYHSAGEEVLYNGMTGTQIKSDIFVGPTYYMRLKHMVKDKINYRARGARSVLTKQTTGGRANDGGLRIGEMERDVIVSHGMSGFLRDSMMSRGDSYDLAICNKSGMIAVYNSAKNIFMSPIVDGPIQFKGSMETGEFNVRTITKFGRSFSIVRVPYVFKLLIQELQTTNIQLRLITADNIDTITDLTSTRSLSLKTVDNPPTPLESKYTENLYSSSSFGEEEIKERKEIEDNESQGPNKDEDEDEDKDEDLSYENMPKLEFKPSLAEDSAPAIEFESLDETNSINDDSLSLSNPDQMISLNEEELSSSPAPSPTFSFSPTIHITTADAQTSPKSGPTSPKSVSPSSAASGSTSPSSTPDADIFKMGPLTVTKMDS